MIEVLHVVLYAVVVLIALLLVALILVQPAKGGGFGSAFGGVGESVFGAQAMSHLAKVTVVMIGLFFALTLALAVLSGHQSKFVKSGGSSLLDGGSEPSTTSAESVVPPMDAPGSGLINLPESDDQYDQTAPAEETTPAAEEK